MKSFYLLCAMLLQVSLLSAQSKNGLVAQWSFNGSAVDSSGNGHNGNITGNVVADTGRFGMPNTGMMFSNSGYISVPYSNDFNFTKTSICAIIKPTKFFTGTCQGNAIIARGPGPTQGHWGINFSDNAYNDCNTVDTNKYVFAPLMGPSLISPPSLQTTPNIHTQNWYCVVVTFDSTDCKLYVNGNLKSTHSLPPLGMSTDSVGIGKDLFAGAHDFPFTGIIDEIWVYNRSLDSIEISSFCTNAGKPSPENIGLLANEKFRQISLYPNPTTRIINLITTRELADEQKNYSIYNLFGQVVKSDKFVGSQHVIDMESFPKGSYIIKIQSGEEFITKRFVLK